MALNGTTKNILCGIAVIVIAAAIISLPALGFQIQDNAHASEVNASDIQTLIMKQEKFIEDTTKAVAEIQTSVAVIEDRAKRDDP